MSEIDKHIKRLNSFCRLCHEVLSKTTTQPSERKATPSRRKVVFTNEIQQIFGIDVSSELEELYPAYICHSCSRALYRYRDTNGESMGTCGVLNSIQLRAYEPHSQTCDICVARPGGRRKKRCTTEDEDTEFEACNVKKQKAQEELSDIETLLSHVRNVMPSVGHTKQEHFFTSFLDVLDENAMSVLCRCIGKKQKNEISADSDTFSMLYKDMDALSNFDILNWLRKRHKGVLSYTAELYGSSIEEIDHWQNESLTIARAVEHIYSLCRKDFISPISFQLNLTAYALTGSRTVVDMLGNASPSGHYKSITHWLKDQGSLPALLPDTDVINVFDNEQVIGKTYSIRPQNKVAVSVITKKGYIEMESDRCLQENENLKPITLHVQNVKERKKDEFWEAHFNKLNSKLTEMVDQKNEYYRELEKIHNEQLYHFINHAIEIVQSEQKMEGGNYKDLVDEKIKEDIKDETYIVCVTCGTLNAKRKIVCTGCEGRDGLKKAKENKKNTKVPEKPKTGTERVPKLTFLVGDEESEVQVETTEFAQFSHVESNHNRKHEITLTDPVYCNPNSLVSVARVLRKIGEENKIIKYGGDVRHWTFICCDGLPYLIIQKLQAEAVVCAVAGCKQSFLSKDAFSKHADDQHPGMQKKFVYEFDWFYLRIGSGHYEMNLTKAFFEMNWIPFLETLCELMGFNSEASKQYAKSCKDHHKSWRLLLVFHLGTLRELVLPYVRHCLLVNNAPTAKGFMAYSADKYKSPSYPNFSYVMDQVCRYSQGIVNFRMATRRNNAMLLKSSKNMTKEMFHGRSHPKYQKIEINDTLQDLMMEDPVRDLNDKYSSMTTSNNFSAGEDCDFLLEEKNKQLKSWIPKGMPTDLIWQTVCRNNRALEALKNQALQLFGITSSKGTTRPLGIDEAINVYRAVLRRTSYLEKPKDHVSLSGMALDENLVNFVKESTLRRIHLLQTEFLGMDYQVDDVGLRHPVPITPEERQKLLSTNNMTIKELQREITKTLDNISDQYQSDYYISIFQQEVKTKGKAKHVNFLEELREVLEMLKENSQQDTENTV